MTIKERKKTIDDIDYFDDEVGLKCNKIISDYLTLLKDNNSENKLINNIDFLKYSKILNEHTKIINRYSKLSPIKNINLEYVKIYLGGKKGGFTIISKEDYESVSQYNWTKNQGGYVDGYVNGKKTLLHKFIMKPGPNLVVNHLDSKILNNTRGNLEITTILANGQNKSKTSKETSAENLGICYYKNSKKYVARIRINNSQKFIGQYNTEYEAETARDMYIIHENIKNFKLIYPEKRKEYEQTKYIIKERKKVSIYNGVSKDKKSYVGRIQWDDCPQDYPKECYRGKNEIECAIACDECVVKYNIPGRTLNFPNNYPNYNPNSVIKTLYKPFEGILNEGKANKEHIKLEDNVVELIIEKMGNKHALINKSDYDKIKYYKCGVNSDGYIWVSNYDGKSWVFLHRLLTEAPEGEPVDHKNNLKADNRITNIHVVTSKENSQNLSKQEGKTSKYMGVSKIKNNTKSNKIKWDVQIAAKNENEKRKRFQVNENEEYAGRLRDLYILEHRKNENFKYSNFEWTDADIIVWRDKLEKYIKMETWNN